MNLIHDTDHYRIAAPSRRKRREFGLGTAPYTAGFTPRPPKRLITPDGANDEETVVSMLDMLTFMRLGIARKRVRAWWGEVAYHYLTAEPLFQRRIAPLLEPHEWPFVPKVLWIVLDAM